MFGILAGVSVCQGPIGPVYAHFIADIITVPLIFDNTWKPSQILWHIKGDACSLVFFV